MQFITIMPMPCKTIIFLLKVQKLKCKGLFFDCLICSHRWTKRFWPCLFLYENNKIEEKLADEFNLDYDQRFQALK